ncbi:MAG: hypothetical protein M1840_008585 [Geoglossum simile]|nr:MAG: hypothetical protein M1840_008585 [Geoglossum simile]
MAFSDYPRSPGLSFRRKSVPILPLSPRSGGLKEPFKNIDALSKSRLSIKPLKTIESIDDNIFETRLLEKAETPELPPPPDGGLTAWTQVLIGHLLVINGFGYTWSFGFFQAYYATTLNRTPSDISWIGSFQVFLLFLIGTFSGRAMDAGFFRTLVVIPVFAKITTHLSPSSAVTLLIIMNGTGIAGRLIPSILATLYFGAFNTLIPCVFGGAVLLYSWTAVHSVSGLVAWAVVYGFLINAVQTLFPSAISFMTTDLRKMGVRVGMVFTIISFACLTGPPIAGALISAEKNGFVHAQLFGGTTMLCGAMFMVAARLMQTNLRDTWRDKLGDVFGRSYGGGWKRSA